MRFYRDFNAKVMRLIAKSPVFGVLSGRFQVHANLNELTRDIEISGNFDAVERAAEECKSIFGFYFPECCDCLHQSTLVWSSNVGGFGDSQSTSMNISKQESPARTSSEAVSSEATPEIDNAEHHVGMLDFSVWCETLQKQLEAQVSPEVQSSMVETVSADASDDLWEEEPDFCIDEGPAVFDGEALKNDVADGVENIQLLVLCGLPGSGKSTFAAMLGASGWQVINQDSLGSRTKCLEMADQALRTGKKIVIDRCNTTMHQRRHWLTMRSSRQLQKAQRAVIWLDVDVGECCQRVMHRFGHKTLPAKQSSKRVVMSFAKDFEPPSEFEGFGKIFHVKGDKDFDSVTADFGVSDLAQEVFIRRKKPLPASIE